MLLVAPDDKTFKVTFSKNDEIVRTFVDAPFPHLARLEVVLQYGDGVAVLQTEEV